MRFTRRRIQKPNVWTVLLDQSQPTGGLRITKKVWSAIFSNRSKRVRRHPALWTPSSEILAIEIRWSCFCFCKAVKKIPCVMLHTACLIKICNYNRDIIITNFRFDYVKEKPLLLQLKCRFSFILSWLQHLGIDAKANTVRLPITIKVTLWIWKTVLITCFPVFFWCKCVKSKHASKLHKN